MTNTTSLKNVLSDLHTFESEVIPKLFNDARYNEVHQNYLNAVLSERDSLYIRLAKCQPNYSTDREYLIELGKQLWDVLK